MSQTYLYLEQRVSDNLSSLLWRGVNKCPLIMKCLCYENTSIFKRSAVLPLIQDRFHPSLGKHCLPKSVQRLIASSERSSARAFFSHHGFIAACIVRHQFTGELDRHEVLLLLLVSLRSYSTRFEKLRGLAEFACTNRTNRDNLAQPMIRVEEQDTMSSTQMSSPFS